MSNGPCVTFGPIAPNRSYNLQARTGLLSAAWSALNSAATPMTNGNTITVTDTNAGPSPKHSRVGVTLP